MGEEDKDTGTESPEDGLSENEAIEFLKLVELARADEDEPPVGFEAPPSTPKPKKRFRLKSKGRKKRESPSTPEPEKPSAPPVEKPSAPRKPQKISEQRILDILDGTDEKNERQPTPDGAKEQKRPKAASHRPSGQRLLPPPHRRKKHSSWWVATLSVLALGGGLWGGTLWGQTNGKVNSPATPPPPLGLQAVQGQPPDMVTIFFFRALSLKRYEDAQLLLSADKQPSLNASELKTLVEPYSAANPGALTQVRIDSTSVQGNSAVVHMKLGKSEAGWEATLERHKENWFVVGVSGEFKI